MAKYLDNNSWKQLPRAIIATLPALDTVKFQFTCERLSKSQKARKVKAGLYVYEIRHADSDWCKPSTIESFVLVNHMGTLTTDKPLFSGDTVIQLNYKERCRIERLAAGEKE